MERPEFVAIVTPLLVALRTEFDAPTWTVYFRTLEDVPKQILAAAVERAAKSATFMPKPGELRTLAEQARHALIAAHPYEGCCECEDQRGWRTVTHADGSAVERCPCWRRHQEKLAELGVGDHTLQLTHGESGERE